MTYGYDLHSIIKRVGGSYRYERKKIDITKWFSQLNAMKYALIQDYIFIYVFII